MNTGESLGVNRHAMRCCALAPYLWPCSESWCLAGATKTRDQHCSLVGLYGSGKTYALFYFLYNVYTMHCWCLNVRHSSDLESDVDLTTIGPVVSEDQHKARKRKHESKHKKSKHKKHHKKKW